MQINSCIKSYCFNTTHELFPQPSSINPLTICLQKVKGQGNIILRIVFVCRTGGTIDSHNMLSNRWSKGMTCLDHFIILLAKKKNELNLIEGDVEDI